MAETTGGSAIVLGGGGVTGIAWEIGVLAGLLDAGVDLGADAVFGTSAGSFVGTALAAGADIELLYAAQQAPAVDESATKASRLLTAAWGWAFLRGGGNPSGWAPGSEPSRAASPPRSPRRNDAGRCTPASTPRSGPAHCTSPRPTPTPAS
ncbi:patatin-like phospholipase family protein [Streptomyces sp. AcH 505]|uniref:patatin-like phospholipase family protein n=1 Tax=Streptomyces sp. AcH 505 TaxID=352211 RepID=UPI000D146D30